MVFGLNTKNINKQTKTGKSSSTSQADEAAEMLKKMEEKINQNRASLLFPKLEQIQFW